MKQDQKNPTQKKIEAYTPLKPLDSAAGLYFSDGEWEGTSFKRRMTVIRFKSGGIIIHNPFQMHEGDIRQITDLGKVVGIIAPNFFHSSDCPWMAARFPDAKVFCPSTLVQKLAKQGVRQPLALESQWPSEWDAELLCVAMAGLRILAESVFIHRPSRTLVLTDLAFNMPASEKTFERWFFQLNQINGRFGPSRIFRDVFVKDRNQFSQSLRQVFSENFDRVIVNHGEIIDREGHSRFETAFSPLLLG